MKTKKTYSFTKEELIRGFELWDSEYLANPNEYDHDYKSKGRSKRSAEALIMFINKSKKKQDGHE